MCTDDSMILDAGGGYPKVWFLFFTPPQKKDEGTSMLKPSRYGIWMEMEYCFTIFVG